MSLFEGASNTIAQAMKDALGRELQEAEKLAAAQLQAVIDHALAGIDALIAKYVGNKVVITISVEDKDVAKQ